MAVAATLQAIRSRLQKLLDTQSLDEDWLEHLLDADDLETDFLNGAEHEAQPSADSARADEPFAIDVALLKAQLAERDPYLALAAQVREDQKSHALLSALAQGFERMATMAAMGAPRKAVIFTGSRRTQDCLVRYLEAHGHAGKRVAFSGSNQRPAATGIYQRWLARHTGTDRVSGSPAIDHRTALIDEFRAHADILIATEAAAEGVNLQFCALVVNYGLPWNPQRVAQRIGRCHRYGQRFDVVGINFLNQRNEADQRVLELLQDKFHLFDGAFGASDQVLGQIESGLDFQRRIANIQARMQETERQLLGDGLTCRCYSVPATQNTAMSQPATRSPDVSPV